MKPRTFRSGGFAIISAVFILVVLAAIGAFIMNISANQQTGSALDVQGTRAYQAARAGIEWGLYQVQSYDPTGAGTTGDGYRFGYDCPASDSGSQCPNRRSCANASGSFDVFGFRVTVVCTATVDGSSGPTVYQLVSTACSQADAGGACPNTETAGATAPGPFYVERRLSVTF